MPATLPMQVNPSRRLFLIFLKRPAIDGVHDDTPTGIRDADDPLARYGLAALRPFQRLIGRQAKNRTFNGNARRNVPSIADRASRG